MSAADLGSRAIIGTFFNRLEQYMGMSWILLLSMLFDSDQASETYKWLGQVPQLREWVGGRNAKGFTTNGITIANKKFETTMEVQVDEIRRDKTGQVMIRIAEMAMRAGGHWGKLLSTLITNGTGSTNGLAYDGQYFFDSDHSEGSSGTQLNLLTNTQVAALDVTTAAAPTALEAARAIIGVIGYMLTYKDNEGEPMNAGARSFQVQASPALWQHIGPGIYSNKVGSGEDNPALALIQNSDFKVSVVPNPYLTSTTVFYIFRTDAATKPFIRQEELPLEIKAQAEGSAEEFNNDRHLYGLKAVRNVGYGMWQYAAHATLS